MGASSTPGKSLAPGDRLPRLELSDAGGGPVRLRDPAHGAVVVAYLARPEAAEAREYLAALRAMEPEFRQWYGRTVVITGPETGVAGEALPSGRPASPVVPDPAGELRRGLGIEDDYALFIADRWGQLYAVWHGTTATDLLDIREIVEWLRFLATQCPECGVPDEPGAGEWAP